MELFDKTKYIPNGRTSITNKYDQQDKTAVLLVGKPIEVLPTYFSFKLIFLNRVE